MNQRPKALLPFLSHVLIFTFFNFDLPALCNKLRYLKIVRRHDLKENVLEICFVLEFWGKDMCERKTRFHSIILQANPYMLSLSSTTKKKFCQALTLNQPTGNIKTGLQETWSYSWFPVNVGKSICTENGRFLMKTNKMTYMCIAMFSNVSFFEEKQSWGNNEWLKITYWMFDIFGCDTQHHLTVKEVLDYNREVILAF